jgi:chaperonin GroES
MIKPTEDRVFLLLDHSDTVTESGFIVPNRTVPNKGTVMAVGPGRYTTHGVHIPMDVKIGDVVVFDKSMASGVKAEGEEYVQVPSLGILAILEA